MDKVQPLADLWTVLVSIVGVIVWFVRLEGRVNYQEKNLLHLDKELEGLRIKHEALDSKLVEELIHLRESLARIEGALGVSKNKE